MLSPILISYTGKPLYEIDLLKAQENCKKGGKPFVPCALKRSPSLRLSGTALVSTQELDAIRETLGEKVFNRFVTIHDWKPITDKEKAEAKELVKPEPKPRKAVKKTTVKTSD
jgi:hypothetical protein